MTVARPAADFRDLADPRGGLIRHVDAADHPAEAGGQGAGTADSQRGSWGLGEPKPIAEQLSPEVLADPAEGVWVPWARKPSPVTKRLETLGQRRYSILPVGFGRCG